MKVVSIPTPEFIDVVTMFFGCFKTFRFLVVWETQSILREPNKVVAFVKMLFGAVLNGFKCCLENLIPCTERCYFLLRRWKMFGFRDIYDTATRLVTKSTFPYRLLICYYIQKKNDLVWCERTDAKKK